jgi:hypothetical protein
MQEQVATFLDTWATTPSVDPSRAMTKSTLMDIYRSTHQEVDVKEFWTAVQQHVERKQGTFWNWTDGQGQEMIRLGLPSIIELDGKKPTRKRKAEEDEPVSVPKRTKQSKSPSVQESKQYLECTLSEAKRVQEMLKPVVEQTFKQQCPVPIHGQWLSTKAQLARAQVRVGEQTTICIDETDADFKRLSKLDFASCFDAGYADAMKLKTVEIQRVQCPPENKNDRRNMPAGSRKIMANAALPAWTILGRYHGAVCLEEEMLDMVGLCGESDWNRYGFTFDTYFDSHRLTISSVSANSDFGNWCKNVNDGKDFAPLNVRFVEIVYNGWPYIFLVTMRDIAAGEEILVDYSSSYWESMLLHERVQSKLGRLNVLLERMLGSGA